MKNLKNNNQNIKKRVYLDNAAATPIDKQVSEVILEFEQVAWANSSSLHTEGEKTKEIYDRAKISVAKNLHCKKSEVFFTSGGTEAANLAIQGVVRQSIERFKDLKIERLPHVITSTIEHPAILETVKYLSKQGKVEVSFVAPDEQGFINGESVAREVKENTVLVCIMHSNNEIGVIQPVRKIRSAIENLKLKNKFSDDSGLPYLLVDASQSVCYEDVSIERLGAHMLILDGLKMYGPRGVGVLVVKNGVLVSPIFFGGGQENGLRSGTENVLGAIGLAKALDICINTREKEKERVKKIRDYAIDAILSTFPSTSLNGDREHRLANNINICFHGLDSEFAVIKLDTLGFAVSAASACHSLSLENSSYVIEALAKPGCSSSSLRFTLGRHTKKTDIDKLISALKKVLK